MYKLFSHFFSGLILSFVSFKILPVTFLSMGVYLSTPFILLGIVSLNFIERKFKSNDKNIYNSCIACSLAIVGISFFINIPVILNSFCGGVLLYGSSTVVTQSNSKSHIFIFLLHLASILGISIGVLVSMTF